MCLKHLCIQFVKAKNFDRVNDLRLRKPSTHTSNSHCSFTFGCILVTNGSCLVLEHFLTTFLAHSRFLTLSSLSFRFVARCSLLQCWPFDVWKSNSQIHHTFCFRFLKSFQFSHRHREQENEIIIRWELFADKIDWLYYEFLRNIINIFVRKLWKNEKNLLIPQQNWCIIHRGLLFVGALCSRIAFQCSTEDEGSEDYARIVTY